MKHVRMHRLAVLVVVLCVAGSCKDSSTGPGGAARPVKPSPYAGVPRESAQVIDRHNHGIGRMGRFEYGVARDVFAELAQAYPDWTDVRVDLAIATLNRQEPGDSQAALSMLAEVLEAEPAHLRAMYSRALLMLYEGGAAEAAPLFAAVAEADPRDAYAAYFLAQCLSQTGQHEQALQQYVRSVELDPYLRSGYFGAFQTMQRLGRADEARAMLATFEKLADNPQARLAEFKYLRMGPKAQVKAMAVDQPRLAQPPAGPLFADAQALPIDGAEGVTWAAYDGAAAPVSITVCDIDGDGRLDLFIAGAIADGDARRNAVLIQSVADDGRFALRPDHPLAAIEHVNAAAWGDYDNDGLTDVYLARRGPNMLWRQSAAGQWEDMSAATGTAGGDFDSVDTMLFDADHDGDLDMLVINSDGPNELFNNNLDGTFRAIAQEQGIAGAGTGSRSAVVADFDHDRDADIFIVQSQRPHEYWVNDRLWQYRKGGAIDEPIAAAAAADMDALGVTALLALNEAGVARWVGADDAWSGGVVAGGLSGADAQRAQLAIADVNGDGTPDVIATTATGWQAVTMPPRAGATDAPGMFAAEDAALRGIAIANLAPARGPAVVGVRAGQPPVIWRPGPGRYNFALLAFTGKEQKADQMRSNRSGIGVSAAVRVGPRWQAIHTYRVNSGPGQSLQPVAVGLGGDEQIDFASITWPDGVFQTVMNLQAGRLHTTMERQRQLASCPLVFAWDGEQFAFVTDVLGAGAIGFNIGRGEYVPPRPVENLLLPAGALRPRDGRYMIKVGEPMEEVCCLDAARLVQYDLPAGWEMALDERFAIAEPAATGAALFYRRENEVQPVRVVNDRGEDVTDAVRQADGRAAPLPPVDARFLGRTGEEHAVVMEFGGGIVDGSGISGGELVLIVDGWIEYPYSQTMFAAWQAGAAYEAPTLEARGGDGRWHTIVEQFGYPAGMPRRMVLPIDHDALPAGCDALRIRANVEVYWDRLSLAWTEPCPEARRRELPLISATLAEVGFARRTTGPQRFPEYDYGDRAPLWDTRHPAGWYTAFGDVQPLVSSVDDAVAVMGPGEEVEVVFGAEAADAFAEAGSTRHEGGTRWFVLELNGWCKDMDLYTRHGETVGPMPARAGATDDDLRRPDALHERFNTRYRSGG